MACNPGKIGPYGPEIGNPVDIQVRPPIKLSKLEFWTEPGRSSGIQFTYYTENRGNPITLQWGLKSGTHVTLFDNDALPQDEYVVSLYGTYGVDFVNSLGIRKNNGSYVSCGPFTGDRFEIPVMSSAIVAFFGRETSGQALNAVGAYVAPRPSGPV